MSVNKELHTIIKSVKAFVELEKSAGISDYFKKEKKPSVKELLDTLEVSMQKCKKCELCKERNNVVFGSGNPCAKLVFVGEGPGYDEDMQGLPFVGRAGKLLTKIIEAMGFKRSDVYIANIVKCRPPQNRNPLPTEMLACEEYLTRQLELIKPKVICALGKTAAQALLRTEEPISRMRGKFYNYRGITLMPTYHPAYLLRNPSDKKLVWHDVKKIILELK